MVLASTIDFTLPLADPVLKFLLILLIILAAPLLLNKLRIPHLLGLIIAGAIIGPHGFNLVLRDSSIILSGTAGLLYIMFLAGLEIDMADFKRNSTKSLAFGMYTFLIPMILGTVVGIWVLRFNVLTSVLLASMFASHTLIAYPIISKLGISKNKAVSITVGGTMITDTLALLCPNDHCRHGHRTGQRYVLDSSGGFHLDIRINRIIRFPFHWALVL